MILVDTNVISEAMKSSGEPVVLAWLNGQTPATLFMTATSLSELLVGIQVLPPRRRKENLSRLLDALTNRLFEDRILPFDEHAAISHAAIIAAARSRGRAIGIPDGQIAAIAAVHGFTVATRDTAPFLAAGVPVLNPWQE